VDARALERAAGSAEIVGLLDEWPVAAGDCLLVPGGTVHAIGRGLLILEVQQNSDTTYRLWDWGRVDPATGRPRATHAREALAAPASGLPQRAPIRARWEESRAGLRRAPLARATSFALNLLELSAPVRLSTCGQWQVYAAVGGSGRLAAHGGGWTCELERGAV